jgi:hypothetical protein
LHEGPREWHDQALPEASLRGRIRRGTLKKSRTRAPTSFFAPGDPRGLFLGDYIGLETTRDDIAFFASTLTDGADVHSIALEHPVSTP